MSGAPGEVRVPVWRCDLTTNPESSALGDLGRSWIEHPALARVAAAFDGPIPQFSGPGVDELVRWSTDCLDSRIGRERHEAPSREMTPRQIEALADAAPVLGLEHTAVPQRGAYDCTVVLGGTVTANRMRCAYVQSVAASGTNPGLVVALSTARHLTQAERAAYPFACSEAEDLLAVVDETFAPLLRTQAREWGGEGETSWFEERHRGNGIETRVLSAPTRRPGKRADTADCLAFLVSRVEAARLGEVLLVTSAIYAPYTAFAAAAALAGTPVERFEVVGTPSIEAADRHRRAQYVAQEMHSALRAIAGALSTRA